MRYTFSTFTAWALCVTPQTLAAQDPAGIVPAVLPRPADKAGDVRKPVQVYILAGQSNMVGMGDIGGARPLYPSVFLSADPRIVPGRMPVGSSALNTLQIFQAAAANASRGATATIFPGAYDPGTDYDKRSPARLAPVTLGAVGGKLPAVDGPHTLVVTAFVQVPTTGRYQVHAGFGRSSHNVVTLDGKEIYRKDVGSSTVINTVTLEKGKRYPVKVTYLQGGSASFWMEQVEIKGQGDLETVTKVDKKFPYLIGEDGSWTVRNDVYFQEARIAKDGKGSPLSATSNGRSIGPEVGFGYVMGTFHEEQVLLIKTAMGNRALGWDFRPPSSGKSDKADADKWEGLEYRLMVEGVRKTLAKLDKIVPGYQGQGYEIAGFAWFQGHKDGGMEGLADEYEQNLVNLIQDVRKEFKAPKMPAVVATVGFGGYRMSDKYIKIWNAQMAVGDPRKHPEFAGTVTSVDIRDFWREVEESPRSQDYHYNRNAESYMLIGEAIGRAMVRLRGGEAAPMPRSGRDVAPIPAPPTKPTEIAKTASLAATVPLVLDGVLATYTSNPRNQGFLQAILKGQGPKRATQFLSDAMDEVANHYRVLGIHDYDWHVFGPDMKNASWDYYSFDPPETMDKAKGNRYRSVTLPAGMEDWFASSFDATKAGWKAGSAPFGQLDGKPTALRENCQSLFCGCGTAPRTLWEKEVLLMRQTFDVPKLKQGHRYRIVVGGSAHVNAGEGFALYVDGQLLAESKDGVYKRQGGRPRGAHIYRDFAPRFADGKVTIAVKSFLRFKHPRTKIYPRGHVSVWLEEMKIPPVEAR